LEKVKTLFRYAESAVEDRIMGAFAVPVIHESSKYPNRFRSYLKAFDSFVACMEIFTLCGMSSEDSIGASSSRASSTNPNETVVARPGIESNQKEKNCAAHVYMLQTKPFYYPTAFFWLYLN
jgi:hypothetical protein